MDVWIEERNISVEGNKSGICREHLQQVPSQPGAITFWHEFSENTCLTYYQGLVVQASFLWLELFTFVNLYIILTYNGSKITNPLVLREFVSYLYFYYTPEI